jgi:zona occludens toxin (predicted ATPase)
MGGRVGNASVDGYSRFISVAFWGSWGRAGNHLVLEEIQRFRVPGLGVYQDKELADRQSALGRNRLSGKILPRWPFYPSDAK